MGNEPRHHHTVPRFLLERFSVNGQVMVVERDNLARSFRLNIKDATAQRDFYTVYKDDGSLDTQMEKGLSPIETDAANAIRAMLDSGAFPPTTEQRSALSFFLLVQMFRGRDMRNDVVEFNRLHVEKYMDTLSRETIAEIFQKAFDRVPTEDDISKYQDISHRVNVEITNPALVHGRAMMVMTDPKRMVYFSGRAWELWCFKEPLLLTGDVPIGIINNPAFKGGGRGLVNAQCFVFPTDPMHALVMWHPAEKKRDLRRNAGRSEARWINKAVAYGCEQHMIHRSDHEPLKGLTIRKRPSAVVTEGDMIGMFRR